MLRQALKAGLIVAVLVASSKTPRPSDVGVAAAGAEMAAAVAELVGTGTGDMDTAAGTPVMATVPGATAGGARRGMAMSAIPATDIRPPPLVPTQTRPAAPSPPRTA